MEWKINIEGKMDVTTIRKKFQKRLVTRISHAFKRWERSILSVCTRIWQVSADDRRNVIHFINVGLALSLVSVFYFVRPMFNTFGGNAIWAVVAVVLAFEFTVAECVTKYFVEPKDCEESGYDEVPRACKFALNSKATEESLASFATWEPPHGRFFFGYRWDLYEKVGNMNRHCAYFVKALHEFSKSEIQAPFAVRENLKTSFIDIGREAANTLRELAERIRTTRRSKSPHLMMDRLRTVVQNLQSSLRLHPELFINSKWWLILEEKPLRIPQNFLEGLNRTENLQASSIPKRAKQADLINRASIATSMQKEGVQTDTSRDRAGKICEMKQSSCSFTEIIPLLNFLALLIETVAKLESLMMAVEELEEAIFKNIDSR